MKKKIIGLIFLAILYSLSFIVGFFIYKFCDMLDDLLRMFLLSITPMFIVYIFGLVLKNTSIINPYWSVQTPVLMMFLMIRYNAFNLGTLLYFIVFCLFAIRLSINYAKEYSGLTYEDWRYKLIRNKTGKCYFLVSFFFIFVMPTLVVFVSSLPMYLYIIEQDSFGFLQIIGLVVMAFGIVYQTIADRQMYLFRKNRSKTNMVYSKGVWAHSRHPNYFGELVLWVGVSFVYVSSNFSKAYVLVCCLPVILLHILISIPISEKNYLKNKVGYDLYKKKTNMLFPSFKSNNFDLISKDGYTWTTFYGNAQSIIPPSPQTYAKDVTLRYPIYSPFDGDYIRITLDNFLQNEDVTIESVVVGIGKELKDDLENPIYVTFNGKRKFTIKANKDIVSDPIPYELKSDEFLIVNIYLKDYTKLTGGVDIKGPLSKGYYAYGNQSFNNKLDINTSKETSFVYFISNIDIYTKKENECVICYGDSITSQDWPDYMQLHLRDMGIKNIAVIRKAVSGTRILREYCCITYQSYGKCGKVRFEHEISGVSNCHNIIIQHGINDIIHPVGKEKNPFRPYSDIPFTGDLVSGMKFYKKVSEKYNLNVYYGTLLPIYGWRTYEAFREDLKNSFNRWIKMQDNLIDFENEISINIDGKYHFKDGMDSNDHLHPSKEAYDKMGSLAARVIATKMKS